MGLSIPGGDMFHRLGELIAARARLVLLLTALVVIGAAVLGVGAFGRLLDEGFADPSAASTKAETLLNHKFGGEPNIIFLVHARAGTVDGGAVTSDGERLTAALEQDHRLRGITSYWPARVASLRSRDGTDALILARVVADTADGILHDYGHVDTATATLRIGGEKGTDVGGQVGKDLALAEGIAVPVTLILLLIAFGSAVAALLPLGISLVAILGTFAELSLLTHVTDVSIFAINLTTALGLGLGIDYALLMVSRFREELAGGSGVTEAVARTTATAGRTIAFSALTVAAALSAMLVFPVYFLKSFAYAGVGVTIFAALSALIVLPAILTVLGHRVNAGHIPGVNPTRTPHTPFWGRLAAAVMRRPIVAAAPVIAVLLFMAVPLLHVTFSTPDERVLPKSTATHQVGDVLRADFTTKPNVIDVLLTPKPAESSAAVAAAYTRQLTALPGVVGVQRSTAQGTERISLSTRFDGLSASAQKLVHQVRATPAPPGSTALVGGATATLIDAKHAISSHLWLASLIIIVTTLVLLFLFTGSVVQPIRALLGNALTLGATLGAMVWIFQEGHLSGLLGFTPTPINTSIPVLLFCVAFGLSMDYEVFLISRIKELHDGGASTPDAVTQGLARTGRIVSTAAALLAVSFFAFGTSKVSFIQFFGLGSGLAILIDATLIRGVLVPASMRAFGERSWWAPGFLRRVHNRIGFSEHSALAARASSAGVTRDRDVVAGSLESDEHVAEPSQRA
jgi:RND superfamily putative drug exporter